MIEAFFASVAVVALAEIGDKTMLLAILLAARFRAPLPILAGIFLATIANHALAALAGASIAGLLEADWFRIAVALGFLAMAAWTLVPDKLEEDEDPAQRGGAFLTTLVAFFLVEIGDKTQVATVALGARYGDVLTVAAGTTVGMMLANGPAVWFGDTIMQKVSMKAARIVAALLFAGIGLWELWRVLA